MRSDLEYARIIELIGKGLNNCEVSRLTGTPVTTVLRWRRGERAGRHDWCPVCAAGLIDLVAYAYLLGLYLGDGCLVHRRGDVFNLEIYLDRKYPRIVKEAEAAMVRVRRGQVHVTERCDNIFIVSSYWKHWPCVFPQHGPGAKHKRPIRLDSWQEGLVRQAPDQLIRGLIHSDGCRAINTVKGREYPRYQFTNYSDDIRQIFCDTCDLLGIEWKQSNWRTISVSRRAEVEKLDRFIGPKR